MYCVFTEDNAIRYDVSVIEEFRRNPFTGTTTERLRNYLLDTLSDDITFGIADIESVDYETDAVEFVLERTADGIMSWEPVMYEEPTMDEYDEDYVPESRPRFAHELEGLKITVAVPYGLSTDPTDVHEHDLLVSYLNNTMNRVLKTHVVAASISRKGDWTLLSIGVHVRKDDDDALELQSVILRELMNRSPV
jgi:hypothetical protein